MPNHYNYLASVLRNTPTYGGVYIQRSDNKPLNKFQLLSLFKFRENYSDPKKPITEEYSMNTFIKKCQAPLKLDVTGCAFDKNNADIPLRFVDWSKFSDKKH